MPGHGGWDALDSALDDAASAYDALREAGPAAHAAYLADLADRLDAERQSLAEIAHRETGLPTAPRLVGEVAAAADQLRQASAAAASHSWTQPTISTAARVMSWHAPLPGVVLVLGPNNFPFRFNAVGGGDFAAAVATGHPVVAKGHPLHPETTRALADLADSAARSVGLPPSMVRLVEDVDPDDGLRLVADRRLAAVAFTGSRHAGLRLKAAADAAGVPFFGELSGSNPVVVLPEASRSRGTGIGSELAASVMMGMGQFCTRPTLVFAPAHDGVAMADALVAGVARADRHPMLSAAVAASAMDAVAALLERGARLRQPAAHDDHTRRSVAPVVLETHANRLHELQSPEPVDLFGPISVIVWYDDLAQLRNALRLLDGDLTGSLWADDADEGAYAAVEPVLRERVGRLLNDKVPTGVAIVPGMNHGGPYPATSNPHFSAIGPPGSLRRFAMLQCYDNVRDHRLPLALRGANPLGLDRLIDGRWTTDAY